jgi:hypothetical protein
MGFYYCKMFVEDNGGTLKVKRYVKGQEFRGRARNNGQGHIQLTCLITTIEIKY